MSMPDRVLEIPLVLDARALLTVGAVQRARADWTIGSLCPRYVVLSEVTLAWFVAAVAVDARQLVLSSEGVLFCGMTVVNPDARARCTTAAAMTLTESL